MPNRLDANITREIRIELSPASMVSV